MDQLTEIIKDVSSLSTVPSIILYLYARNFTRKFANSLASLLTLSLVCDLLNGWLSYNGISNAICVNIFHFVQLPLIVLVYASVSKPNANKRNIALGTLFVSICTLNTLFVQPITTYQSITWSVSTFIIMIISFAYFISFNKNPVIKIETLPAFWVTVGLFFYCSFSFIILSSVTYLTKNFSVSDFRIAWMFHNLANIFKSACFTAAIWWSSRRSVEFETLEDFKRFTNNKF
jgi:hypothetical protein